MSSTLPSLGRPAQVSCARVAAVVEHAEDVEVGVILVLERDNELFAVGVGTDHHGAAIEPPVTRPFAHQRPERDALGHQCSQAEEEEGGEPQARHLAADLGEERGAHEQQEHKAPRRHHPRHLPELAAKHLDVVEIRGLETDDGGKRDREHREYVGPHETADVNDVAEIDGEAANCDQCKIDHTHQAGNDNR
jgi:hypothetical protein